MNESNQLTELAIELFQIGAFLDKTKSPDGRGFKLKLHQENPNAPLSPYYLNLGTPDNPKPGPLTPEIVADIGRTLYEKSQGLTYHHVAGVPRAGDPLARAFLRARQRDPKKFYYSILKLGKKESSSQRQVTGIIEGAWFPGEIVLVIDDLIDSKLETIKTLEEAGLAVRDVLVLIDREQGGAATLNENGYNFHAVFKFSDLLALYQYKGLISREIYKEIRDYLRVNK